MFSQISFKRLGTPEVILKPEQQSAIESICKFAYGQLLTVASFPGPCTAFVCTKERGGPGMFLHVRDVEGRKVVERAQLNVGELGLRTARRAKVTYHMYIASGGRLSYTPSVERVVG